MLFFAYSQEFPDDLHAENFRDTFFGKSNYSGGKILFNFSVSQAVHKVPKIPSAKK